MASPNAFPPLWRVLGLSVAIGYAGLGSYAALLPIQCAEKHGLKPTTITTENEKYVRRSMVWIGARDVSIAAALFAFYFQDKPREMGTVILSGVILTTVDGITVWNARKDAYGASVALGGLVWAWIGWKLLEL